MGRKNYPCFRRTVKDYSGMPEARRPECEYCDSKAVATDEYEFSYMRGEDENLRMCGKHRAMARSGGWNALSRDLKAKKAQKS